MKRLLILILFATVSIFSVANPVEIERARLVAANFLTMIGPEGKAMVERGLIVKTTMSEFPGILVFTTPMNEGFVLVSADDQAYPILGYSVYGRFDTDGMPLHVRNWLHSYQAQLDQIDSDVVSFWPEAEALWDHLLAGERFELSLPRSVSPLVSTTWGQSGYYNLYCPDYDSTQRCVTGCVATGLAQVLKYWNWPNSGEGSYSYAYNGTTLNADFGSTTYDWNHMPDVLDSTSTIEQIEAVAQLMLHAGVAVKMSYGTTSYSYVCSLGNVNKFCIENALQKYFKYKTNIRSIFRESFTDSAWCAQLRNEMDHGRPVIYSAFGIGGGHCFILDGYDNAGLMHVNWGWDGMYDGYYRMGNLLPEGNYPYHFDWNNQAVIGVEPLRVVGDTSTIIAQSNNEGWGVVTGGGSVSRGSWAIMTAKADERHMFSHWSDGSIYNPRPYYADGNDVELTAVFKPVVGDTLGYCNQSWTTRSNGWSAGSEWGIKFPYSVLTYGHSLYQVQAFLIRPSNGVEMRYQLRVYSGGTSRPRELIYTQEVLSPVPNAWNTIYLDTPVEVRYGEPMWVMLKSSDYAYPMAFGFWSGNTGVSMCRKATTENWEDNSTDGTFMLRGVFGLHPPSEHCSEVQEVVAGSALSTLSDTRVPINLMSKNTLTEVIVDSVELGGALDIDRMSIHLSSGLAAFKKVDIYLQHTTLDTFASVSEMEPFNSTRGVKVYSGILSINNGWVTIPFDTIFTYDGHSNLLVIFDAGTYYIHTSARGFKVSTTDKAKTACVYSTEDVDVEQLPVTHGTSFVSLERPVLKLHGCVPHAPVRYETIILCDDFTLDVTPNDSTLGVCAGGGVYHGRYPYQVMAIPSDGHRFVRWSDGCTDNPRTIMLRENISLIAIFE